MTNLGCQHQIWDLFLVKKGNLNMFMLVGMDKSSMVLIKVLFTTLPYPVVHKCFTLLQKD